jgi:RNA polymerase sigma-70 factor (ECF subfamily)
VRRSAAVEAASFTERAVVDDPRVRTLELALARLPADRREVIVLSRFHDLSYEDLSQVLGCSVGAARVRVHRALAELKQIVHELETHDGKMSNRA